MPTPEIHAAAVKTTGGLAAVVALAISPVTLAGLIGSAFGVAFAKPMNYREGLLWLFFGLSVSLFSNAYLISKIGDYGAGIAFFVALITVVFREPLVNAIKSFIARKGDSI